MFVMRSVLARQYEPGEPHAVLVLPDGMGGDGSTAHLRWGISGHGYTIHGWNQGRNLWSHRDAAGGPAGPCRRVVRFA